MVYRYENMLPNYQMGGNLSSFPLELGVLVAMVIFLRTKCLLHNLVAIGWDHWPGNKVKWLKKGSSLPRSHWPASGFDLLPIHTCIKLFKKGIYI